MAGGNKPPPSSFRNISDETLFNLIFIALPVIKYAYVYTFCGGVSQILQVSGNSVLFSIFGKRRTGLNLIVPPNSFGASLCNMFQNREQVKIIFLAASQYYNGSS